MQKFNSSQAGGFWLVTGAAITWGTIGIATQAIYNSDTTTSLFINLTRMLIATPILALACWRVVGRHMFNVRRRDLFIMMLSGVLLAASQAAYFAAIRYAGVTITTLLIMCISPVIVAAVSVLLKLETLTRRKIIALACAVAGSVLLVGFHSPEGGQNDLLMGTLLSLFSAVTYAGTIICGRFLAGDYHPLQVNAVGFGAGTVALLIVNLLTGFVPLHTPQGWLLVLYLGLVPTALAYWIFQMGLRSVSATVASIISMIDPVVAAVLAWALFGETLETRSFIGAALLFLSIFLLSLRGGEQAVSEPHAVL